MNKLSSLLLVLVFLMTGFSGPQLRAQESPEYINIPLVPIPVVISPPFMPDYMFYQLNLLNPTLEGPTTPVPAVPTNLQLYQSALVTIIGINAELTTVQTDLNLYQFLLGLDPDGADSETLNDIILDLISRRTILQNRLSWWRDYANSLL